jgi:hypothetical protein
MGFMVHISARDAFAMALGLTVGGWLGWMLRGLRSLVR